MSTISSHRDILIRSVPETMIQSHGHYKDTSLFKIKHSGETFRLPHYNLGATEYFNLYAHYLKMLLDTSMNISIYHMNDSGQSINLVGLEREEFVHGITIENFIYNNFRSNNYAFYIEIDDTTQYDIERSLITNSTFQGECNICYQTNSLKHYYNCDLKDKKNHHGICGSCCISWHSANPENSCPLCRSPKKTSRLPKTTYS